MMMRTALGCDMFRIVAITGLFLVAFGTFGAHGLENILDQNGTLEIWKTASLYHLAHAVALLVLASSLPSARWAFHCFFYGILVFSGTLYLLAVTNIKWLGAITPLGGLALI